MLCSCWWRRLASRVVVLVGFVAGLDCLVDLVNMGAWVIALLLSYCICCVYWSCVVMVRCAVY